MGKKAKAHRQKVAKRNKTISDNLGWARNQETRIIKDLIEREMKNGQYDSEFMKNYSIAKPHTESDIVTDAEVIEEIIDVETSVDTDNN